MQDFSFGIIPYHKETKRFLLIRHLKDHWSFPKGHAENNETSQETALRELFEETGIKPATVDPREFFENYSFVKKETLINKRVTFFIGFIEETVVTVQETEVGDFAWLHYEEALKKLTYESTQHVLREAHAYLKAHHNL